MVPTAPVSLAHLGALRCPAPGRQWAWRKLALQTIFWSCAFQTHIAQISCTNVIRLCLGYKSTFLSLTRSFGSLPWLSIISVLCFEPVSGEEVAVEWSPGAGGRVFQGSNHSLLPFFSIILIFQYVQESYFICTVTVHFPREWLCLLGQEGVNAFPSADKIQSDRLTQVLIRWGMRARIPASASKFGPIKSHQVFLSQDWCSGNLFHRVKP